MMSIKDLIRPECVQVGSAAKSKQEVLEEIARLAKNSPILADIGEQEVLAALEAREKIGATGFEQGVAIPHCALEDIQDFVVAVLLVPEGIDFGSADGERSRIFFFIVGPASERNRHIQILSSLSKITKHRGAVEAILSAADRDELLQTIYSAIPYTEKKPEERGQCLFHVFIQEEEFFEEILQIFSAAVPGSITVLEGNNAGTFLHRIPLFAAYWSDRSRSFNRIILAVVDKALCNEVMRRINMIVEDLDRRSGVLVAVQDLLYVSGSLEF